MDTPHDTPTKASSSSAQQPAPRQQDQALERNAATGLHLPPLAFGGGAGEDAGAVGRLHAQGAGRGERTE